MPTLRSDSMGIDIQIYLTKVPLCPSIFSFLLASLRDFLFFLTRESRRRKPLQHIEDRVFIWASRLMQEKKICIFFFTLSAPIFLTKLDSGSRVRDSCADMCPLTIASSDAAWIEVAVTAYKRSLVILGGAAFPRAYLDPISTGCLYTVRRIINQAASM